MPSLDHQSYYVSHFYVAVLVACRCVYSSALTGATLSNLEEFHFWLNTFVRVGRVGMFLY